jgi:hypothetical protein
MPFRTLWAPARLATILALTGCVAQAHHSSPWEFGGGVRPAPGFAIGHQGMTVHPTLGYTYLSFSGGHDDLIEVGAQLRRPVVRTPVGGTRLWLGAEAAFAVLRESGSGFPSSSTSGWSLNALAGVPVLQGKWGPSLYSAVGISHYGSAGVNVRFGVDLQPSFLKR